MKFLALLALGAGAVAALRSPAAHPVHERDLGALAALLQPVVVGLEQLTDTTSQYPAGGVDGLEHAIDGMIATVSAAARDANMLKPLTMEEAYNFRNIADKMTASGNAFFAAMQSKIPLFGLDHVCGELVDPITNLGGNVTHLMNTVESKFTTRAGDAEIQHFGAAFEGLVGKLRACGGLGPVSSSAAVPYAPGTTHGPSYPGWGAPAPTTDTTTGYRGNATVNTPSPSAVFVAGADAPKVPSSWMALVVALTAVMV